MAEGAIPSRSWHGHGCPDGRSCSPPIGLAGGVNLYAYAGNNPVAFSDPYGLDCPPNNLLCVAINSGFQTLGALAGFIGGGGLGLVEIAGTGGLATPAAVVTAAAGTTGGLAIGTLAGDAVTDLLFSDNGGSKAGSVKSEAAAAKEWLSQTNRKNPGLNRALSDWFKEGGDLPKGITRQYLQKYRTAAEDAVKRGIDKSGVQRRRIEMIDETLKRMQ